MKKTKSKSRALSKIKLSKQAEFAAQAEMMRDQLAVIAAGNVEASRRGFREALFFQFLSEGVKPTEAATKVAMTANDLWARMHASESATPAKVNIATSPPGVAAVVVPAPEGFERPAGAEVPPWGIT